MTTEHGGSGDINRSLELMWGLRDKSTRGPKPGLTVEQIIETAVKVADAEGLAAVSMRRIASELGVGTMSLYRHVPGKEELLDLMLEWVEQCVDDDVLESQDWRSNLSTCAHGSWRVYVSHPWLLHVDRSRQLLGPNALAGFDQCLRGLRDTRLTDQEKVAVVRMVDSFTTGIARIHVNAREAEERTGISDEEFWQAQKPVLTKALGTGNYPKVASLSENAFNMRHEELFEFGLERILDGLEALIVRK